MASTSPEELAAELLEQCFQGVAAPDVLLESLLVQATDDNPEIAGNASRVLFRRLAEPLADLFEPELCNSYVYLFSRAIELIRPDLSAGDLTTRYFRLRQPRHFHESSQPPRNVYVLSRVTLGADVAITSIILDAAKKRFPASDIYFVGGNKGWELFAADSQLKHLPISYAPNGTLTERITAGTTLGKSLDQTNSIVIDPDSRLTQLGLLPICQEDSYYFFESRAYGGNTEDTLSQLTKRWVAETFGVVDALPYMAPEMSEAVSAVPGIAMSFGVGENPAKRIPDPFEQDLVKGLLNLKIPILIDQGAGGDEAVRVKRAIEGSGAKPGQIETWDGAFAPFAACIADSRLYVGYDSAGQHVAATCGTPLVSIFTGFPSTRAFARWQPTGSGPIEIIQIENPDASKVLQQTLDAVNKLLS